MILEMLGPSIEDLYIYCHRKFSLKTVVLLGEQMLERICHIHRRSIIHREYVFSFIFHSIKIITFLNKLTKMISL